MNGDNYLEDFLPQDEEEDEFPIEEAAPSPTPVGGLTSVEPSTTRVSTSPGGLTSTDPVTKLTLGQQRMEQLTQYKKQLAAQAAARQAAMQQYANMIEQSPGTAGAPDQGLVALSKGILSRPGQFQLGVAEGMAGMEDARRKLAEREWARKAGAQKVRAETEQMGITDIINQANLEGIGGAGRRGAAPHIREYTNDKGERVQVITDPYTGETTEKVLGKVQERAGATQTATRILSEIKKSADLRDAAFLSDSQGNKEDAAKRKQAWIRQEYNTNPVIKKLGTEYVLGEDNTLLPPVQQKAKEKEQEKASETVGKGFGEQYIKLQEAAANAQNKKNQLARMNQLLEGVETGKLTPAGMELAGWAKSFGVEVDPKLGNKEAATALINQFALELRNPSGGAGMPGAMSDSDRRFLIQMAPSLSLTTQGRKLLTETMNKLADRDIEVAQRARNYRKAHNGTLDEGFYDELAVWSNENPLFGAKPTKATQATHPEDVTNLLGEYGKRKP